MATPHAPGFTALFVSAELTGLSDPENEARNTLLRERLVLAGFTFDEVHGRYHGQVERSFRVCLSSHSSALARFTADCVRSFAREFGQESVLVVSPLGQAVLVYDDSAETIGQWSRCEDGDGLEDYSRIGDEYFCVVPDIEVAS